MELYGYMATKLQNSSWGWKPGPPEPKKKRKISPEGKRWALSIHTYLYPSIPFPSPTGFKPKPCYDPRAPPVCTSEAGSSHPSVPFLRSQSSPTHLPESSEGRLERKKKGSQERVVGIRPTPGRAVARGTGISRPGCRGRACHHSRLILAQTSTGGAVCRGAGEDEDEVQD